MKKLFLLLFVFVVFILSTFDGKTQTALEFDGVDDYVKTTYPGIFQENARTFMAWIYLFEAPTADMCILDYGSDDVGARNTLMVNASGYLEIEAGGPEFLISTTPVPIGEWVHVAFGSVDYEGTLYQNGIEVVSGSIGIFTPGLYDDPLRIGERVPGGSIPFKGMIDEVSIWDANLLQYQINSYTCLGSNLAQYNNLVAYYNFEDGTGTTLTDLVSGNDGTLMNMDEEDWVASTSCPPVLDITFVVTKDDGVTPIKNVMVDLDGDVKYTDISGEVIFQFLDPDTYDYTLSKTGYFDETGTVDVIDEDVTVDVSLTLTGENYDISFMVTDGTNPLENALVDFDGVQQYTNTSGQTIFTDVLPENYPYIITKDGYLPAISVIEVIDEDITVDVSLYEEVPTALEFDGEDDYIQTTCPGILQSSPRTVQAWIYLTEAPTHNMCITDYGFWANGSRNTFKVKGNGYLGFESGGEDGIINATVTPVPIGSWVHVAFVFDGTFGFLYQDGEQVGTGNLEGLQTIAGGTKVRIGQRIIGGDIPFKGMIDEVSVWDVALAQQEIMNNACIGNPVPYPDLFAYYDFNDGQGTTLTDLVAGANGTLMNMDEEEDWVLADICGSVYNIAFVVTEDDGTTPIENAEVDLDGDILYTDANGEAVFNYSNPGSYNYTISKPGYFDETGTVDLVDDDVTVEVSLILTGIEYDITFVVTDELTGDPVENALVNLDGVQQLTDEFGETVFTGYLSGVYDYSVTNSDYYELTGSVEVIDNDVTENVALAPIIYYDITFIVTEGAGTNPLEDALVELDGVQQYTNASGETTFSQYLPDIYPFTISKDGYFAYSDNVEVVDANVTVEVSLWPSDTPTALEFDGVDDYVQTTCPGIDSNYPRTFQAWIYLSEAPSSNLTITDYGVNAAGSRNTFIVNGSGYLAYLSGGTNANISASVATVPIGSWVHVAFVYDGITGYLYQDGELVGSATLSGMNTTSGSGYVNLRIGERVPGGSINFKGMIDEVKVWDKALTQQEVIDYACIDEPSLYSNLVTYYDFNEGTGTTLHDISGAYNGTLLEMEEEDWVDSDVCGVSAYNISFVVTEEDGTTPIENVSIELEGEINYTDANGEAVYYTYDPGTYNYTITKDGYFNQSGSIDVVDGDVTVEVSLLLEWQVNPTDIIHTIQIPTTANPNIFGEALEAGDWMGVFYINDDGMEVCGGATQMSAFGSSVVNAYGNDLTTGEKDGFDDGEVFRWLMFDVSEGLEYYAIATYDATAPNQEFFTNLGTSKLVSLDAVEYLQNFTFESGWNSMSSYLTPENPDVEAMFASFVDNLEIFRNMTQVYWPGGSFNTVGDFDNQSGYVLFVNEVVNYQLPGSAMADDVLTLEEPGWHFMPVLSECPVSVEELFGDQLSDVIIIMELIGTNMYWQDMSITTLTELQPGKAYSIKTTDAISVEFPACELKSGMQNAKRISSMNTPWGILNLTPNKQATVFLNTAINELQPGDIIGAFNTNNTLCGMTTLNDLSVNTAINLCGNDDASSGNDGLNEGEAVSYKLYRPATGEEFDLNVDYDQVLENTSGNFYQGTFAAVGNAWFKASGITANISTSVQMYPNPAQDEVSIHVSGNGSNLITVIVFDLSGRTVLEKEFVEQTKLNVNALEAGVYSVKILTNNDFNRVEKLIIR